MRIIGVDLHARQQSIAMLDTETGEVMETILEHEGEQLREFYSALPGPVLVGIEATGSMTWFLKLMEELKIECRVGHPAECPRGRARPLHPLQECGPLMLRRTATVSYSPPRKT